MKRSASFLLLVALSVACSQVQPPQPSGRIEVEPGYALLTQAGATIQLSATVYDGNGTPTTDGVSWHASDPAVLQVGSDGKVTAAAALGSGQVVARARGLESAPVLIVVAQTVPGAVLVADDQVVGDIEPVDPDSEYEVGWQYTVTLTGVSGLAPGDLVVGTGELPIGGRVIATEGLGAERDVTLAVTPLEELFQALELSQTLNMASVQPFISETIKQTHQVNRVDGAITFTPLGDSYSTLSPNQATGTRALGPFACSTDTAFNVELTTSPSFTLTPSFGIELDYDLATGGLKKLAATGGVEATFKIEPKLTASFDGSLKCEVELLVIPVPVGGPLSFVLGAQIPVGAGFELKGKVAVAQLGLKTSATGHTNMEMGINCPSNQNECDAFATGGAELDARVEPLLPDIDDQLRVEAEFSAYAFADVAIGMRWSKKLRVQTLRFSAAAQQKFDLATVHAQVADTNYASKFDLRLVVQVKAGSDIEKLVGLLNLKVSAPKFDLVDEELARSPSGTFTISPASVPPAQEGELGRLATFRIELDPVTYLGVEAVEKVQIFWKKPGEAEGFTLESGRPACVDIPAQSGQTTFECQTDFLAEHEGEQTYYAFVHVKLFGVSLPVPLEVASDGKATVTVDPEALDPGICENMQGVDQVYLNEDALGDGVATATSFRKVSARANDGYAEAETYDFVAVLAEDEALAGQIGYLRVRFRYRFESSGSSETSPAARVTLYPQKIFESSITFQHYAGSEPSVVEETVERDIQIRFAHDFGTTVTSSPIAIGAETFRSRGGIVKAEAEWLGIVDVRNAAREPVGVRIICVASGTDYY